MKKIMMTLATLFVAVCASAQVYIGGGFSLANTSVTTIRISAGR